MTRPPLAWTGEMLQIGLEALGALLLAFIGLYALIYWLSHKEESRASRE